jgi:ribosomal protein S1
VDERYEIDQLIKGVVTNIVDFGAFVRLEPGVEGLVHVSEMASGEVGHSSNVMQTGDDVLARIISIDSHRKRIGLSMRAVPALEGSEATEPLSALSGEEARMEEESLASETLAAEEPLSDSGATEMVEAQEMQEEPVSEEASVTEDSGEEKEVPAGAEPLESEEEISLPVNAQVLDREDTLEASVPEAASESEDVPDQPTLDDEAQPEELLEETAAVEITALEEAPADPASDPSENEAGLDPAAGP